MNKDSIHSHLTTLILLAELANQLLELTLRISGM